MSQDDTDAQTIVGGRRLGPYQLEGLLGEGGMGQVYRARDTRLGRPVAVKVIHADKVQREDFRVRFQREAHTTAALNHPHVCTLYDVGEQDGASYLVMEFVDGHTLASQLREGPLSLDQFYRVASETAQALAAAHARGIIHRDLKPANLMITAGGVKVLDFGLAKFASSRADVPSVTAEFTIVGTPAYMSPEQTRGDDLDARSDIFSLGCVLYEAATGIRPFRGSSVPEILQEIVMGTPALATSLRADLPAGWDAILARALDKDRNRRYSSGAELFADIETLRSSPVPAYRSVEREPDPVFGRDGELAKLGDLLAAALQRHGNVVLIAGEPGIGKTSLTRNFVFDALRRHPDLILARGSCIEQYGTGEPYLPFLDAVGSLLQGPRKARVIERLRTHAPTWCLQFPAVFSSGAMDQILREVTGATKDRMLREFGDAVVALTGEMPLLLILEDMHWADPASVDMMRHLAERAHAHRVLLLATARPEDIERNNPALKKCYAEMHARSLCTEIALTALSVKDVAQYLDAQFAPNAFPTDLAAIIHRKSEGHPLFATGAVQILVERGNLARDNGTWKLAGPLAQLELDVPVTVRNMIEKKVALLADDQRQALQYASIEGEVFTSTVLGALLEADELELEERLDRISKGHRLIRAEAEEELPDGSLATVYRFSHALYQNFLYDQLLAKRKALLHRRTGEVLERAYTGQSGRVAGALATHFERGRDFEKAVRYLIEAGDTALSRYANAEAVAHFTHGLELIDKLQDAHRAALHATLLQKRAQALTALGQLVTAGVDYRAMREVCRASGDPVHECRALIGICTVAFNARDVDSMETFNPQARALAEQIGNETLMADATVAWAMYKMVCGQLSEADTSFRKAIPTARRLKYRPAMVLGLTYEGILQFWHSDYAKAEGLQSEASGLAEQARDGFYLALSLYYLGLTRANLGRIGEAMATMNEALDLAKRNNNALALSRVPNGIGWVWREIGNLEKAIEFNEGCVEVTQRTKAAEAEANALINLVYDYLEADRANEAAGALERILPLYEREKWNRWRFYGVRHRAAQAQYGLARMDLDAAEEHARAVLANAQANRVGKYTGIAHRLLGEIAAARGDASEAELALACSLEAFAAQPTPLIEWRSHASMGRLLAARNRPAAARESFARAAHIVEGLAASLADADQRANFLEMRATREVIVGAHG